MSEKKRSGKAFSVLQRIGKSFFLPISILPFAGILLGVGASFTNPVNLDNLGLTGIMGPGTLLGLIMQILSAVGGVVFDNLPLLFAIAVTIGFTKREQAVAVMSSAIGYLVMNKTINVLLTNAGSILPDGTISPDVPLGSIANVLGIQTLQMGVFGGIVAGALVAYLHNRFYTIELPTAISFFQGTRFVPIISIVGGLFLGVVFYFIWPFVQTIISGLGQLVVNSGYAGTFLFGFMERALIPFGLHHAFYIPIWTTELGGSMEVAGELVHGAQNIYFAQLRDPNTTQFSISAARFLVGKYPFMMGGLVGAALAMYHTVPKENRDKVKGLYFGAAATSFLTGITEPIEFTFLFLSPLLFAIHVVLAGVSFVVTHALNISVGTTFSDGLIDFIMFGPLQGAGKTNWPLLIPVIIVYFIVYYFLFRFLITKWNVAIPGRAGSNEAKLYTKEDYLNREEKTCPPDPTDPSATIVAGLGGVQNICDLDNCATRLRISVEDTSLVNDDILKITGAMGVLRRGNAIQVIYGPKVTLVKAKLEDYIEEADKNPVILENNPCIVEVSVPLKGYLRDIGSSKDQGFADRVMGDGYLIEPEENSVYAPVAGTIHSVFETKHAIALLADNGDEILIHMGLDTVELKGQGFNILVEAGDKVVPGQKLAEVDFNHLKELGYGTEVLFVYTNERNRSFEVLEGPVEVGQRDKIIITE